MTLSEEDSKFLADALTKMADLTAGKSDLCFHCGKQIKTMRKIGRCV